MTAGRDDAAWFMDALQRSKITAPELIQRGLLDGFQALVLDAERGPAVEREILQAFDELTEAVGS